MFKHIQHIHFVGIGGSGMSGIAEVLLTLGYQVSGSDLKASDVTRDLVERGARVFLGHKTEQVVGSQVVVTSTAVSPDNPEVLEAMARHIPVIPRIEMLAELARLKYTIAVAGTHGKTTTTSLASWVLQAGGLDPTVIVGGRMSNIGTGARVGRGDYLVAEADESDGSFLKLTPTLAVVTNIDDDHLDYWGDMRKLEEAFEMFANKVPFYGTVFLGVDDARVRALLPRVRRPQVTYGLHASAHLRGDISSADQNGVTFRVFRDNALLGSVRWPVWGQHNVINALAAVGLGLEVGVPFKGIAEALATFQGVARRLEVKGERGNILVVDDYGHHPTEIAATLEAAQARWPGRPLVALFQPHRYTRTQLLADLFPTSFARTERVLLMDIYPAGEPPIPGVDSDSLAAAWPERGRVGRFRPGEGVEALRRQVPPGSVLMTIGAGDVWKWGEAFLES